MASRAVSPDWDLYVDTVVHSINTRKLRVHSSIPADLLLGFNPNRIGWDTSPSTERAVPILMNTVIEKLDLWKGDQDLADRQLEPLTKLDKRRAKASEKIVWPPNDKMDTWKKPRFRAPKADNLVLLH